MEFQGELNFVPILVTFVPYLGYCEEYYHLKKFEVGVEVFLKCLEARFHMILLVPPPDTLLFQLVMQLRIPRL